MSTLAVLHKLVLVALLLLWFPVSLQEPHAIKLLTVHVLLLPLVSVPSAAFELLSAKSRWKELLQRIRRSQLVHL